jgi:ribosomal-protein-alanine N-acetyltransferase
MPSGRRQVLETGRLAVRFATIEDVDFFYALWTEPQVMKFVGFPYGLRLERSELEGKLSKQGSSEFDHLLVLELKTTGQAIGECYLSSPNEDGISEPDVKLLPQFWGHKYGVEAWRALVDYQFTHTACTAVQGTPNIENLASIKMQEAVGAVRIDEGTYQFPEVMRSFTQPVHYCTYRLLRVDWERNRSSGLIPHF